MKHIHTGSWRSENKNQSADRVSNVSEVECPLRDDARLIKTTNL